jgi:hypothetical protein
MNRVLFSLMAFSAYFGLVNAATVELTDRLALSDQAANAINVNATYNFTSNATLHTGTVIIIAMPHFAGADPTIEFSDCNGTRFVVDEGDTTGANYSLTVTSHTANITSGTECKVVIGNLTNPSTTSQPSYKVSVTDGIVGIQTATVPNSVSSAQITAAIVTLTDTLALTSTAAGATSNAAYTFQSDIELNLGTQIEIKLPYFSGTAATTSSCSNGGNTLDFDITNSIISDTNVVTLTTKRSKVAVNTDCTVTIAGLTNPAVAQAGTTPSYTVKVIDGSVGFQPATAPDTDSDAAITAAIITLTDTLELNSQAAEAEDNMATYTFKSDLALGKGTTLTIAMPDFEGTGPNVSVSSCNNNSNIPNFTIAVNGTGADYKLIVTVGTANDIVADLECAITIGLFDNPNSGGAPAYTVRVVDNDVGIQVAMIPDTVSSAFITTGTPTFSPAEGRMGASFQPDVTSAGSINECYTTDGQTPSCAADGALCAVGFKVVTTPIPEFTQDTTLKVQGCVDTTVAGSNHSAVATAVYTVPKVVGTVVSSAGAAGTITIPTTITLTSSDSTAICYSTNGIDPVCADTGVGTCTHGTLYTGAFDLTTATTLKAIGCFNSMLTNPDSAAAAISIAYNSKTLIYFVRSVCKVGGLAGGAVAECDEGSNGKCEHCTGANGFVRYSGLQEASDSCSYNIVANSHRCDTLYSTDSYIDVAVNTQGHYGTLTCGAFDVTYTGTPSYNLMQDPSSDLKSRNTVFVPVSDRYKDHVVTLLNLPSHTRYELYCHMDDFAATLSPVLENVWTDTNDRVWGDSLVPGTKVIGLSPSTITLTFKHGKALDNNGTITLKAYYGNSTAVFTDNPQCTATTNGNALALHVTSSDHGVRDSTDNEITVFDLNGNSVAGSQIVLVCNTELLTNPSGRVKYDLTVSGHPVTLTDRYGWETS